MEQKLKNSKPGIWIVLWELTGSGLKERDGAEI